MLDPGPVGEGNWFLPRKGPWTQARDLGHEVSTLIRVDPVTQLLLLRHLCTSASNCDKIKAKL